MNYFGMIAEYFIHLLYTCPSLTIPAIRVKSEVALLIASAYIQQRLTILLTCWLAPDCQKPQKGTTECCVDRLGDNMPHTQKVACSLPVYLCSCIDLLLTNVHMLFTFSPKQQVPQGSQNPHINSEGNGREARQNRSKDIVFIVQNCGCFHTGPFLTGE